MSEFHYVRTPGDDGGVDAVNGPAIGLDVDTMVKDGLPPWKVVLELVAALCEILDIADQDGEFHGDVGPEFIFVDDLGAVSLEGFGADRGRTRAPEGKVEGPLSDLYGLGHTIFYLVTGTLLEDLPVEDPDDHDDAVIDAVVAADFGGLAEEMIGDVQWFIAKLMSWDPEDRPAAVEAWRTFIAFAAAVDGPDFEEWSALAIDGDGERRTPGEAPRPTSAPDAAAEDEEDLGGPVVAKGPLSRGGLSFGGSGAKPGQATAFWTKEDMKAALDAEEEEEAYRPQAGGGSATAFWSKDQMDAMSRGDSEAPRPKRKEGLGAQRTMMFQRPGGGEGAPPERQRSAAAASPPPSKPVPPPKAQPVAQAAPQPAAPPPGAHAPVAQQAASPPVGMQGPYVAEPEEGGGGMKWIAVGVVALLVLVCGGVVLLGGGGAMFFGMQGEKTAGTVSAEVDKAGDAAAKEAKAVDTGEAEEEKKEEAEKPAPAKTTTSAKKTTSSKSTSSKPSTTTTRSTSTRTTTSTKPASSSGGSSVRPSSTPRSAPAAPTGPISVSLRADGRGSLRCTDGQTLPFDGTLSASFEAYNLPVTCMIQMDDARGAVTFERGGTVSCSAAGGEVTCQ